MKITGPAVAAFTKFVRARERHRIAKVGGRDVDKPDPIITKFRFCNVRRNDDRVTKWIHENYLYDFQDKDEYWFAMIVARLFNNEDTLADIKPYVLPFKPEAMRKKLHKRADAGLKNFNGAYIVSTNGHSMNKVDYLVDLVLCPAWAMRKEMNNWIENECDQKLELLHKGLLDLNGMASFMAAQVVADMKYADPGYWTDFDTFCASGPGSKRGLNRVMGIPIAHPWNERDFRETLLGLREQVNSILKSWQPITAQDIQNCLCEYDKYERARLGEGTPKQLYKPKEN